MASSQRSLFGREATVEFDRQLGMLQRTELDESAWIDHAAGWLKGHETLLESLALATQWQEQRREMYDRTVDVPRLVASIPEHGPGHPILHELRAAIEARYGCSFPHISLAYYLNGTQSVAWHGDYVAREMPEALVATVSLGQPRRFLLRPKGGGASRALNLGWGDLLVIGGACQRTWEHAVPKVAHTAGPRIAVMFRPNWYAQAPKWRKRENHS